MGLIKTSVALAGGFALIKAASKAVGEHEERKQKRQGNGQYPHGSEPQRMPDGTAWHPQESKGFYPGQYQQPAYGAQTMYPSQQQGTRDLQSQTPPPYQQITGPGMIGTEKHRSVQGQQYGNLR